MRQGQLLEGTTYIHSRVVLSLHPPLVHLLVLLGPLNLHALSRRHCRPQTALQWKAKRRISIPPFSISQILPRDPDTESKGKTSAASAFVCTQLFQSPGALLNIHTRNLKFCRLQPRANCKTKTGPSRHSVRERLESSALCCVCRGHATRRPFLLSPVVPWTRF